MNKTFEQHWRDVREQVATNHSYVNWHQLKVHCRLTGNQEKLTIYLTEAAELMAQSIREEYEKRIEAFTMADRIISNDLRKDIVDLKAAIKNLLDGLEMKRSLIDSIAEAQKLL